MVLEPTPVFVVVVISLLLWALPITGSLSLSIVDSAYVISVLLSFRLFVAVRDIFRGDYCCLLPAKICSMNLRVEFCGPSNGLWSAAPLSPLNLLSPIGAL